IPFRPRSVARTLANRLTSSQPSHRLAARTRRAPRDTALRIESLEDRTCPTVLDLSLFAGQTGMINGAILTGSTAKMVSGSRVLHPFVVPDKRGFEQGYTPDARPYTSPNDAGNTATFNHSIQLSDLPVVVKGGIAYYEFVLDANQDSNRPYISLDELRLYVSS